jgi:GT2 family glycosyltransferase
LPPPLVSIIILTRNREKYLVKTLSSVLKQTYSNLEIIVVDNASTDDSIKILSAKFPSIRIISLPINIGIAGWNIGLKKAHGKYCVMLDDDCSISPNWILNMVKFMEKFPKIAAVSGKVINGFTGKIEWYFARSKGFKSKLFLTSQFHGAAVAFRTSLLKDVGGYPSMYFIYEAELPLAAEFISRNFYIAYYPHMVAFHFRRGVRFLGISNSSLFFRTRNTLLNHLRFFTGARLIFGVTITILTYFFISILNFKIKIFVQAIASAILLLMKSERKTFKIPKKFDDYSIVIIRRAIDELSSFLSRRSTVQQNVVL